jgi:diguanylate cyclase (GGDEF)-like protein/PAS domain S-box-containing protein
VTPVAARQRSATLLARLEPLVPLTLALHGAAVLAVDHRSAAGVAGVTLVGVLAAAGLLGWRTQSAITVRCVAITVVACALLIVDTGYVLQMRQWYYAVVATYPLLLTARRAVLVGPVTAGLFLLGEFVPHAPATPGPDLLRAAILLTLGLLVYAAGSAYLEAQGEIAERQAAAVIAHDERERTLALLETYFAHAPMAMGFLGADGRYVRVNAALAALTGWAAGDHIGRRPLDLRPDASVEQDLVDRVLRSGVTVGPVELALPAAPRSAEPRYSRLTAHPVRGTTGEVLGVGLIAEDITEGRRAERALERAATHDALTGLPNRTLFSERLGDGLARRADTGEPLAVMFVDLDRFKTVNDSLGHGAGDSLLIDVARRITSTLRPSDTVARLGGDEFAVLCEGLDAGQDAGRDAGQVAGRDATAEARHLAARVLAAFADPVTLAGRDHVVTVSVGLAVAGPGLDEPGALLRAADVAMYEAKAAGRNRFALYDETMQRRVEELLSLEQALRAAVEAGALEVAYQPIVSLRTGRVVTAEALARWRYPDGTVVPPATFIPLAEELGLIDILGQQVLEQALAAFAGWRVDAGPELTGIAVNIAVQQLAAPSFAATVAGLAERYGVPLDCLVLEVTENALMSDVPGAERGLVALRELGVQFAVDDFGTGYSSLAYLRHFPVSALKIDRVFVADLERDATIVRSVLSLAAALGLKVVAEGVESPRQREILRGLGCDNAQGYLMARPMAATEFGRLLADDRRRAELDSV